MLVSFLTKSYSNFKHLPANVLALRISHIIVENSFEEKEGRLKQILKQNTLEYDL